MTANPHFTYKEIMQQPDMWLKEYELLLKDKDKISAFVSKYLNDGYEVIYTGAGTSSFIGDVLEFALRDTRFHDGISVPTTDIITHPYAALHPEKKALMVSFARSGNSPESIGAIRIAEDICRHTAHIYITCNAEGQLARTADRENTLLLLLPPETNDQSLAMTSSFSTMLLAAMMMARIETIDSERPQIEALVRDTREALAANDSLIRAIAGRSFDRAVFLGSGELKGIAEESHLKLQELTDGEVMCSFDTFLGFRHGPKAVINGRSLLVYLFSSDPAVRRYETDLVAQINSNNNVVAQVAVSTERVDIPGVKPDLEVLLGAESGIYGCIPYVFTAQLMGYYKSLDLGLNPDSPSVSGNISRVVEGVTIYE